MEAQRIKGESVKKSQIEEEKGQVVFGADAQK